MSTPKRYLKTLAAWLFGAFLAYNLWILGHVVYYRHHNPRMTAFMARGLALLRVHNPRARLDHQWVAYPRISYALKAAVITSEDERFLFHHGFDWAGIRYAMDKNLHDDRLVAGGSTISQQLAKNLFLSPDRSFLRKGEEAVITVMLEAVLGKRRIFEIYLNVIQWGRGIYGIGAAARYYFGVPASALTEDQAATLAAMIPDPTWCETHRYGRGYRRRVANILTYFPDAAVPR